MEALEDLERERGQVKPSKRTKWRRLTIWVLFVLAPLLTKLVQLGIEIFRALR